MSILENKYHSRISAKMKNKWKYEVSLLCPTYNSSFVKTKKTLLSFLCQRGISFDIIVADDGSTDNHEQELEDFFSECCFTNYKLVMNKKNAGTVKNYMSGLEVAEGRYCKALSPGDYFHDEDVIRQWLDYLEVCGAEWSFSDAIYYREGTNEKISVKAHPQDLVPYHKNNDQKKRWNYVVLNDIAVGAAILGKTDLQKNYCLRIINKGIKYAEDNMWRLMMFDNITAVFYEKPTIYYEYGSGISTGNSQIWADRLSSDWKKTDELMSETSNPDKYQRNILRHMGKQRNFLRKVFTKGKFKQKIKKTITSRMTPIE